MTRLQRVQIGEQVLYAAAMILMKDRDATLDALSKGVTMEATIEAINFTVAVGKRKAMKRIAALRKEGFELLAVALPDGLCKTREPTASSIGRGTGVTRRKRSATAHED
jgi:hypothetical protein